MNRICSVNLKNIVGSIKYLQPISPIASSSVFHTILKRFQTTDKLENAHKMVNKRISALEKERQAEVLFWHALGRKCINPAEISDEQWQHLYELDTKHQRQRYCRHLMWKKQFKEEKKERAESDREAKKGTRERIIAERAANEHIVYGLGHNSLLLRVCRQTLNKWRNRKLLRAALFGQKIILDCSYEGMLTDLERSRTAKGLKRIYSENHLHKKPLDLHFCNVQLNSTVFRNLSGQTPNLFEKSSLTKLHTECFMELFSKEQLVMLTPDSDTVFKYDPHAIYIVGAIVDIGRNEPLTLAKAKRLGIRTARFPLDNLRLREGDTRELTMFTVIDIIRECQLTDDINKVIRKCVKLNSERKEEERERTRIASRISRNPL